MNLKSYFLWDVSTFAKRLDKLTFPLSVMESPFIPTFIPILAALVINFSSWSMGLVRYQDFYPFWLKWSVRRGLGFYFLFLIMFVFCMWLTSFQNKICWRGFIAPINHVAPFSKIYCPHESGYVYGLSILYHWSKNLLIPIPHFLIIKSFIVWLITGEEEVFRSPVSFSQDLL